MFPEVGRVRFAATSADPGVPTDFATALDVIEITERQLLVEASTFPEPQPKTAPVGNDETAPIGETAPFDIRARNVLAADVTTLRDSGFDVTGMDMELTSKDGKTVSIYRDLILQVTHVPVTKGNVHPYVRIQGTKTTIGKTQSHETTVTP